MMRLLYAPTSPYVRKVMVSAHLLGLTESIELLASAAHPIDRDARIAAHNPVAKVPTLILADGQALYDSRVICEYLDSLAPGYGLFPKIAPMNWQALTRTSAGRWPARRGIAGALRVHRAAAGKAMGRLALGAIGKGQGLPR